jgi:hypothetical protein
LAATPGNANGQTTSARKARAASVAAIGSRLPALRVVNDRVKN